jgi:UDP-N-acetylglucosamine--N-acetylmuramyl-(pentapeptide) pyrophosphoryl-undecaprenol N-acetylglucosamine transferase
VPPAAIPLRRLALRSLRSVERDVHLVLDPLRLALSIPQAAWLLARWRPAVIFTTGGYVAIPVLMAARLLRIPTLLWEGNVIPGRSVRTTARLASALAVSFPSTCGALRRAGPCLLTGTPIRDLAGIDRLAARERLGLAPADRLVVIFGGSQAVRRLNAAVAGALPELVKRSVVIHVAGPEGMPASAAARSALPEAARERYRPAAFLGAELLDALAAADLVVGRAGSSTLAEAAAFGLPMIVIPYPHAGAHQRANAAAVANAGAATLIDDGDLDATSLLGADLLDALAAADLVVGRAGSSTLAEATAFGLPMIVIPYPHAGAHQRANAAALAEAGAATYIADEELDAASLLAAVANLGDPARHAAMAAAARALGRPGAADAVAAILVALAERRALPDAATIDRIAMAPAGAAA